MLRLLQKNKARATRALGEAFLRSHGDPIGLAADSGKIGQIFAALPETGRALDNGRPPGGLPLAHEPVNRIPNQRDLITAHSCGHASAVLRDVAALSERGLVENEIGLPKCYNAAADYIELGERHGQQFKAGNGSYNLTAGVAMTAINETRKIVKLTLGPYARRVFVAALKVGPIPTR